MKGAASGKLQMENCLAMKFCSAISDFIFFILYRTLTTFSS
jgi:hypothetical protein